MSINTRTMEAFITFPFEGMKALQEVGQYPLNSAVLAATAADASIQFLTERNITAFQYYFGEINIKILPITFRADMIAAWVRLASLVWSSGCLLNALAGKVSFLPMKDTFINNVSMSFSAKAWGAALAGAALTYLVVAQLNNLRIKMQGTEKLEELGANDPGYQNALKNVTISWQKPTYELITQWTAVLQASVNIALAVFSDKKIFYSSLAALNLYTLAQTTKRDWLEIVRVFTVHVFNGTRDIRYTYNASFFKDAIPKDDTCAVCQESPSRKYYFCLNHSYDLPCLTRLFISATDHFKIVGEIKEEEILRNGRTEKIAYEVEANESIKPHCPTCRVPPRYNSLSIEVYHSGKKSWWPASITWVKAK